MPRTPDRLFPETVLDVAGMVAALADRSRAVMCVTPTDGHAWTVGELSSYVGVARLTANEHINVLEVHGLVIRARQGRHCYVIISGPETARVVEALGAMSALVLSTVHSLNAWTVNKRLLAARTCYRHLAGRLGVSLAKHFQERGYLDPSWRSTGPGGDLLAIWGLEKPRRTCGETCIDSTERQLRLGGPLGTALTQASFGRAWIMRIGRSRAAKVAAAGREALAQADLTDVLTLLDETTFNDATG